MQHSNFIHLHVHSQYSLLDGTIRFEEVFDLAKKYRMDCCGADRSREYVWSDRILSDGHQARDQTDCGL